MRTMNLISRARDNRTSSDRATMRPMHFVLNANILIYCKEEFRRESTAQWESGK